MSVPYVQSPWVILLSAVIYITQALLSFVCWQAEYQIALGLLRDPYDVVIFAFVGVYVLPIKWSAFISYNESRTARSVWTDRSAL